MKPQTTIAPDTWIDKYSDYLFNYTIVRVEDREIAKDLIQETFFAGLRSMKNFKGEASERTWLIAILKRKIIDHYRKVNSQKGKAEVRVAYAKDSDQEGEWLEERVADPYDITAEDHMENTELGLAIHDCIGKLPQKQAVIFSMKTIQNFDTETICNEFDITPSNLWVIIHRARTSLSECMKQNWF